MTTKFTLAISGQKIQSWDELAPLFETLEAYSITSESEFRDWLKALSDLESYISEDLAWRYIKMTCDTENEELENDYLNFVSNIQPHIAPWEDKLNKKLVECSFTETLKNDPAYSIYFRRVEKDIKLFREENIPLQVRLQTNAQKFGSNNAAMTIDLDGKELTLQQAAVHLKYLDRDHREI
ncbi:MAG: M3 family oligoendopeptidase, partial [Bacteroidota bacterium]|nr:M3 family oligoendopeptidase [Bacteroidota bacterium]MDX5431484.1 M3 family oligoendopeptidase [Bacteroidota bacterium]MDX5470208.1 M3 family oligoendopeptidase [Bacteroidota bacterium]